MTTRDKSGLVLKAVAFSALLNLFLVLSEFAAAPKGGDRSLFVQIADAIAAPPGLVAKMAFAPKQHTVNAFVVSAAESLICSFVFYVLLAWAVLKLLHLWQMRRTATVSVISPNPNERATGPSQSGIGDDSTTKRT